MTFREFLNERNFYVSESKSGGKIIPKDKEELKKLVEDESVHLGDFEIPKHITDLSNLFEDSERKDFSGIEKWNVSHITDMNYMFAEAEYFTGKGIERWNVSNVTDMSYMFYQAKNFNADISRWNVSKVEDMSGMQIGFFQVMRSTKVNSVLLIMSDMANIYPSELFAE